VSAQPPRDDRSPYRDEACPTAAALRRGSRAGSSPGIATDRSTAVRRLADQRRIAQRVQEAFLPKGCPTCAATRVAARHVMSEGIGGDLYDFVPARGGHHALIVGDVIGHDLTAALVMSLIFGTVHTACPQAETPGEVIGVVNDLLCDLNDEMRYNTMVTSLVVALVNPYERTLRYVNAGHPAPLLARRGGHIEELMSNGMLLGVARDPEWSEGTCDLEAADRLLLYTDGAVEARDAQGQFFGTRRLADELIALRELRPDAAIEHMLDAVLAFGGGHPSDDITLIVADFLEMARP
jgi:sigma-B regulation protein RsbU (phosphoserine phosphatase)